MDKKSVAASIEAMFRNQVSKDKNVKNAYLLVHSDQKDIHTEDLLKFMQALVSHQLVSERTLQTMMADRNRFTIGIQYGYGIWHLTPVPLLMPKRYASWGVAGVTGAFMFYHPEMDAYFIGSFNDCSYKRKFLQFMGRTMNQLWKGK